MPGLSKVIVLDPDGRAGRQIQLGFLREGVPVEVAAVPLDPTKLELPGEDAGLVVVGGTDHRALDLLKRTRNLLESAHIDAPIVFAGRGIRRTDAEAAGADEVVLQPAYLRDVVTIGRLLRGQPATHRAHIAGSLAELTGVFTLVRALATLGRSAILTLIRGLRRGEVRFYHGEVTSAQVGLIHGQAALHQLLLWTDARFDFHHEDVVRRHQIPLDHDELFADAERFLAGVRDSSGALSPAMVLEQDVARVQVLGKQIPTEVHGVLRMFDGHRVLADVLEDSPYRVFETLRVTQLAVDVGLLRIATAPRPKATWRAILAIEEWLVGTETREDVVARTLDRIDSGPVGNAAAAPAPRRGPRRKRKSKKRRTGTLPLGSPITARPEIDWGSLVPRAVGTELGPLAGIVPAAQTSGEIVLPNPSRAEPREKLEAVMDGPARERIFPAGSGEPKVVWDEVAAIERERLARAEQAEQEQARAAAEQARLRAQADAKAEQAEQEQARAAAEQARLRAQADAKAEQARADVEAEARRIADQAKQRADADAEQARADAEAEARRIADQAEQRADADAEQARAEAEAEARRTADQAEHRTAADEPAVGAAPGASEVAPAPPDDTAARATAEAAARARRDAEETAELEARYLAEREAKLAAAIAAEQQTVATEPIVVAETSQATVLVSDTISLAYTAHTARLTAVQVTTIAPVISDSAAAPVINDSAAAPDLGAPLAETIDEPSDGIIRTSIAVAETAPTARRPPPGQIPQDDRPDDTTGEFVTIAGPRPATAPAIEEPSILVADLAAVHAAISAVAAREAAAPATPSIASPAREQAVVTAQHDATSAFTEAEEAFFRAGHDNKGTTPPPLHETFDDLDEDYQPVGFWNRLRGKKPRR